MENVNDDGWMDAAAYDDELPFGNFNDNEKIEAPVNDDVVGVCPCCGTNVVERDMAYFCDNMDCSFAIWKDNKFFQAIGKEMTREIIPPIAPNTTP